MNGRYHKQLCTHPELLIFIFSPDEDFNSPKRISRQMFVLKSDLQNAFPDSLGKCCHIFCCIEELILNQFIIITLRSKCLFTLNCNQTV